MTNGLPWEDVMQDQTPEHIAALEERWQARERELLARNTELVEKLREAEGWKERNQQTVLDAVLVVDRLHALEQAVRNAHTLLKFGDAHSAQLRLAQSARTTIHTYTCGCRVNESESDDGLVKEVHNHPCPNHGGHI